MAMGGGWAERIEAVVDQVAAALFAIPAIGVPTDELLLTERAELLLTEPVELLLTDADRLRPAAPHAPLELALEDIVSELAPDSRVVRLFDPTAMPTPGQLNARIEQHLGQETSPTAPPDASQALYDALAELRRSLR